MSEWRKNTAPNPGSDAAVSLGCSCPVEDNKRGAGAYDRPPGVIFWLDLKCPLHGSAAAERSEVTATGAEADPG